MSEVPQRIKDLSYELFTRLHGQTCDRVDYATIERFMVMAVEFGTSEPSAGVPPPAADLETLIADFEAALAEPGGQQHGICQTCGVDHNNEQRLNRAVIALTLRRLKKLRLSPPPPAETPRCTEVSMGSQIAESGRCALKAGHSGSHALVPPPADETWQDIETAPKEGAVLAIRRGVWAIPMILIWLDGPGLGEPAWRQFDGDSQRSFTPTHWMPLPSAPAKETP